VLGSSIAAASGSGCELYAIHDALAGTTVMIEKRSSVEELDEHGSGEAVRAQTAVMENLPPATAVSPHKATNTAPNGRDALHS
jgi:hypothetical protein